MNITIPEIVKSISHETMAIATGHLETFLVDAILNKEERVFPQAKQEPHESGEKKFVLNVIPVYDVLLEDENRKHGIFGYRNMRKAHQEGEANQDVVAHMLHIKSPGGSVRGLAETSDQLHASTKPVYAFVEGMACSAAYYLAAAASKIGTTTRSSMLGNVGSKFSYTDLSGILENFGAKKIEVYGTDATKKDLGFAEALKGEFSTIREILIDPSNQMFIDDMLKYRPSISKDSLNGIVYYSQDALKHGFVDELNTYEGFINSVLSDLQQNNSNMSKKVMMLVPGNLAAGIKLLGAEVVEDNSAKKEPTAADETADQAKGTPEKKETPEKETPSPEAATNPVVAKIEQKVKDLESTVANQQKEIENKDQALTALQSQIEALAENNPAAQRSMSRAKGPEKQPEKPNEEPEMQFTMSQDFEERDF